MKESDVKKFIARHNFEYYLGKILGEEKFTKIFGYLNPTKKFEELNKEEIEHVSEEFIEKYGA